MIVHIMSIEKNSNGITLQGDLLDHASTRFPAEDLTALALITRLKNTSRLLGSSLEDSFHKYDLSSGRFYVLNYLYAEDLLGHAIPSPSDIAAGLGVTRATITGLLDGLQNAGYIMRRSDVSDRRALTIHLTEKAHKLFESIVPVAARMSSRLMAQLTDHERQTLSALLTKIDTVLLSTDCGEEIDGLVPTSPSSAELAAAR